MLEMNYDEQGDRIRHSHCYYEGYLFGYTLGGYQLPFKWRHREKFICRYMEKWPNRELTGRMRAFHEAYDEIDPEADENPVTQDFVSFMEKYETLRLEELCKKIWRESEYWHGSGIRDIADLSQQLAQYRERFGPL